VRRGLYAEVRERRPDEPLYDRDPQSGASIEVFFADLMLARSFGTGSGWFWWACLPGYLPDIPPHGPFATSYGAYRDALLGQTKQRSFGKRIAPVRSGRDGIPTDCAD
jgi:hypothetical protein